MGKLNKGQKKTYRIQKDAMAEFGYELKFTMRGSHVLNDSVAVWFPRLTDSIEDIRVRGFGNLKIKDGDFLIEIAADDRKLNNVLNSISRNRIVFSKYKNEDYCFEGLYKYDSVDKTSRKVTWKRIAAEIDTKEYPSEK